MKLSKDFSKAYSTKYLTAITIISALEAFVGSLESVYPTKAAIALAVLSGIGLVLRAIPQEEKEA